MRYVLRVPDMSCEHCKMRISKVLEDLGVEKFEISLEEIGYPVEYLEEV